MKKKKCVVCGKDLVKSYLLKYQETYCGRVEVKAKSLKEAREKAVGLVEEGNGDIISSEVIILK